MVSVAAGLLMGFFYRFVAASMSTDFINLEPGKLSPYTAIVMFSRGPPCVQLPLEHDLHDAAVRRERRCRSGITSPRGRRGCTSSAFSAGLIWNLGMSLSIIAADAAGFAISYGLGQGATLVGAFWGVFIWKEFKAAPAGTSSSSRAHVRGVRRGSFVDRLCAPGLTGRSARTCRQKHRRGRGEPQNTTGIRSCVWRLNSPRSVSEYFHGSQVRFMNVI